MVLTLIVLKLYAGATETMPRLQPFSVLENRKKVAMGTCHHF